MEVIRDLQTRDLQPIVVTQTFEDVFEGWYEKYPRKLKKQIKYTKMTREELQERNILCVAIITHHILKNGKIEFYRKPKVFVIRTNKQLHALNLCLSNNKRGITNPKV